MQDTLGGGGGGGGSSSSGSEAAAEKPVEKVRDIFDLKMKAFDAKAKIKIIKEIRTITGLGLKEVGSKRFYALYLCLRLNVICIFNQAKELVEGAPCVVKTGLKKEEADELAKVLKEAGAEIELV